MDEVPAVDRGHGWNPPSIVAFMQVLLVGYLFFFLTAGAFSLSVEDFEAFNISDEKSAVGSWTVVYDRGTTDARIVLDVDPLLTDGASNVLKITGEDNSYSISMKPPFRSISENPIFSWKWKVTRYPEGANISDLRLDDSAAQVYVNFDLQCKYLWYPCIFSICYFYGTTMRPGETFLWSGYGTYVKFISVRSVGTDGIGAWFLEERNVVEDYHEGVLDFLEYGTARKRAKFKKGYESALQSGADSVQSLMLEVHSVAIWVDSNDTETTAESYFDDLQFVPIDP